MTNFLPARYCRVCKTETIRYKTGACKPCSNAKSAERREANKEKNRLLFLEKRKKLALERRSVVRKICTVCKQEKDVSEFRLQKRRDNLPMSCCKSCEKKQIQAYRLANPEKRKETVKKSAQKHKEKLYKKSKEYRLLNKEVYRVYTRNRRARQKTTGVLSKYIANKLYILQKGKCACGCKQPLGSDYHLDHIMPIALGGTNTDDNIQLLCKRCNLQKNAKHPVDFMQQRGFLL